MVTSDRQRVQASAKVEWRALRSIDLVSELDIQYQRGAVQLVGLEAQWLRASIAAQTGDSTPLPTMTTSKSSMLAFCDRRVGLTRITPEPA